MRSFLTEKLSFLFQNIILFICCLAVLALHCCAGFFLAEASRGSSFWCTGLSLRWLLLLRSRGSRALGLQWLWHEASVAAVPGP